MPNFIDLTGKRYGKLVVISRAPNAITNKLTRWNCKCDCGNRTIVYGGALRKGETKSCRCLANELTSKRSRTHFDTHSKEYRAWISIKKRCYNINNIDYSYYGGRGIIVCKRWRNSYKTFLSDMGRAPSINHSIDRKNNNGNYTPKNCKWSTMKEQSNNRRKRKKR